MPEDSNHKAENQETVIPPSKPAIPIWVFVVLGTITLIIALLLASSFFIHPKNQVSNPVTPTPKPFSPQIVFTENFDSSHLEGWTMDWVSLHESTDGSGYNLLAYPNMPPDKRIKFTYTAGRERYFYARSNEIPLNFTQSYTIAFDFHGKGPIELLDFGHIRLRLMDELPNLSFDRDGTQSYKAFPEITWNSELLQQEKHSFRITVDPGNHFYDTYLDGISLGRINFAESLIPQNQIYFRELLLNPGEQSTNAVYYDNFNIFGTPTKILSSSKLTIIAKPTSTPTPVPPEYIAYLKEGWDKHNSGDFNGAIRSFQQAIKINPKSAEAYNALGVSYRSSGDTTAALRAFVQSLSIDSTYIPAKQNLGVQ